MHFVTNSMYHWSENNFVGRQNSFDIHLPSHQASSHEQQEFAYQRYYTQEPQSNVLRSLLEGNNYVEQGNNGNVYTNSNAVPSQQSNNSTYLCSSSDISPTTSNSTSPNENQVLYNSQYLQQNSNNEENSMRFPNYRIIRTVPASVSMPMVNGSTQNDVQQQHSHTATQNDVQQQHSNTATQNDVQRQHSNTATQNNVQQQHSAAINNSNMNRRLRNNTDEQAQPPSTDGIVNYAWMNRSNGMKSNDNQNKRTRQTYKPEQTLQLEAEFHCNQYLTRRRRQILAASTGLTERQVKIWFQNRRMKFKKENGQKLPLKKPCTSNVVPTTSTITQANYAHPSQMQPQLVAQQPQLVAQQSQLVAQQSQLVTQQQFGGNNPILFYPPQQNYQEQNFVQRNNRVQHFNNVDVSNIDPNGTYR